MVTDSYYIFMCCIEVFLFCVAMDYVRDKRSPKPKSEHTSRVMRANRPLHTGPENLLYNMLAAMLAFQPERNCKDVVGRPDIAFINQRLAVFVHGCYWHRCPHCMHRLPKHNSDFWQRKFAVNRSRDRRKTRHLRALGWSVFHVWECKLKHNPTREVNRIISHLNKNTS